MLNKLLKTLFNITILLLCVNRTCGQTAPVTDGKIKQDEKSTGKPGWFKFGINYSSNNVFMGRTDSVATPYFIPEVKYTLKSGLFMSASAYYIPNKKTSKLDGGEITAGYDFDITDDLSGSGSYTKQFYSATSTEVTSSIGSTFNVEFDYDLSDICSPSVSFDYIINKQGIENDFFAGFDIDHDFIKKGVFGEKDIVLFAPGVSINTGAQDGGKFELLNYEISTPLIYKSGHFIFQLAPRYSIAKNLLPDATGAKPSNKTSVFYFETGVFLKF